MESPEVLQTLHKYQRKKIMRKHGRVGTIAGLDYQFPSGIAVLSFTNGKVVYIESGCGLRALASCFGATEGKGDLLEKILGRRIRYETDFMNAMVWFAPLEN
jgi:hypothetical protein